VSDQKPRYARRLTHAEAELWTIVTASVRPFRSRPAPPVVPPAPPAAPAAAPARTAKSAPRLEWTPPPPPEPRPAAAPHDIDRRERMKIKRGRLDVDAKLDLHGLRQDEAQRALTAFLRRAQADGAKVAIVVTGKGLSREEGGVLRRVVPMWLQAPNLRDVVVSFGEAARHHGGEGALYVRIRRADRLRGGYD
jgi:DNA-nicking Smr family endonuclease